MYIKYTCTLYILYLLQQSPKIKTFAKSKSQIANYYIYILYNIIYIYIYNIIYIYIYIYTQSHIPLTYVISHSAGGRSSQLKELCEVKRSALRKRRCWNGRGNHGKIIRMGKKGDLDYKMATLRGPLPSPEHCGTWHVAEAAMPRFKKVLWYHGLWCGDDHIGIAQWVSNDTGNWDTFIVKASWSKSLV